MPNTKFIVNHKVAESFRINKVKGMFDCQFNEVKKEYDVNIPIEDMNWNVGLIVGASGTGKTTIAKNAFKGYKLFKGYEWNGASILDDFAEEFTPKQITEVLSKVGFSSPPDWLKPFNILSNGQKMRVELARLILEEKEPFLYDEFTSFVDRQVACVGSSAIQKFVRKNNKQFIAISCHYDIKEWLEPDWIYDVNEMKFLDTRGSLRRPEIKIDIREGKQEEWQLFKHYHYLNASHNRSAKKYVAEWNGRPVAWCSLLHFPHPKVKNMKRIHRIVVLPDFQGIGVGYKLNCEIAKMYKDDGFRITLVTSSPSLINGMVAKKEWIMTQKPIRQPPSKTGVLRKSLSSARLTASFEYVGK
jgi:ABC-type lipoprotein export system ATPase subunit